MNSIPLPQAQLVSNMVKLAIAEDLGPGDITADVIPAAHHSCAQIITRDQCVISGIPWVNTTFSMAGPTSKISWHVSDGQQVQANTVLCAIEGPTRALLGSERIALNFLQTLSAVATCTRRYVDTIKDYNSKILDTRKTIPGLRLAQKYAVACGGGHNHRFGLYDAILIKENHIIAAGGIAEAIASLRQKHPKVSIEIEVENLAELETALHAGIERVLLDNFSLQDLEQAVLLVKDKVEIEASGGITLHNVADIAKTGVHYISIGAITKNIQAVDLSMRIR